MRNVILFDDDSWEHLLPLTYTRPAAEMRCGILTIREKWERYLEARTSYITQEFLAELYPIHIEDDNLVIAGNVLPDAKLLRLINDLSLNEALMFEGDLIAARLSRQQFDHLIHNEQIDELIGYTIEETPITRISRPWQVFHFAGSEIEKDYQTLTRGRTSAPKDQTTIWEGDRIFIEAGAEVRHCIIDGSEGPVYIGKDAKLLPGSVIKGPFAIGEGGVVKMGAKIYGPSSFGPYSKVGGEVNNVIIFGYSNKSHDGYLGNAVIGEWCNLGADTNASNLRNDYGDIQVWSHQSGSYEETGLQFCGLIMGDHSKCGINTMFNTGTVVGVMCNIYGSGFHQRFIPSFSWGGGHDFVPYRLEKAMDVAERVMQRRGIPLSEEQKKLFQHIFDLSQNQK